MRAAQRPAIDLSRARAQHSAYAAALRSLGWRVVELAADEAHPDCVFVEDTAVVLDRGAVACAPGAASRRGEVAAAAEALAPYRSVEWIGGAATLDGGDVLVAGDTLFVGRSARTNEAGIAALAALAAREGKRVVPVAVRGALHLKSAATLAVPGLLVALRGAFDEAPFAGCEILAVEPQESTGANVLPAGGSLLVSAAAPRLRDALARRGIPTIPLDVSEFEKGDGGLTCLSILVPAP